MENEQFLTMLAELSLWVGLCSAIGAYNQRKGGPFLVGLVLALLLTPVFGVLIVALSKDETRICPSCAERIRKEATVCRFYTRDVATA